MALAAWLASNGIDSDRLVGLRELAARLRACEDQGGPGGPDGAGAVAEPKWSGLADDARRILREFLADAEDDGHRKGHRNSRRSRGGPAGQSGPAVAPFWKRSRRAP